MEVATETASEPGLGQRLSLLAKLRGQTQENIASHCKISRISVNRFFRERTEIRAGDFRMLLKVLGIDLDAIIDRALERQIHGTNISDDPLYMDLATILHGLDDLTRRTLLDQIRFWSVNLKGGAERRATERLLASVK
jgi:transcriptional regulator with XRE-family HTH domain